MADLLTIRGVRPTPQHINRTYGIAPGACSAGCAFARGFFEAAKNPVAVQMTELDLAIYTARAIEAALRAAIGKE